MRFLKAVILDVSDARVYADEGGAARDGEWVVPGSWTVCDLARGHRRERCHCDSSFVGVGTRGRATVAEIADIAPEDYAAAVGTLAAYFGTLGAPTPEVARAAAEDECRYTAELCEGFEPEVWITVRRSPEGEGWGERYSVFRRLMIGSHRP